MERGSLDKLKFDNRLQRRKGWLSNPDKDGYLADLADVSDKIYIPGEEEEAAEAAAAAAAEGDAPETAVPVIEEPVVEETIAATPVFTPIETPSEVPNEAPPNPLSPPPFKEV